MVKSLVKNLINPKLIKNPINLSFYIRNNSSYYNLPSTSSMKLRLAGPVAMVWLLLASQVSVVSCKLSFTLVMLRSRPLKASGISMKSIPLLSTTPFFFQTNVGGGLWKNEKTKSCHWLPIRVFKELQWLAKSADYPSNFQRWVLFSLLKCVIRKLRLSSFLN